MNKLEYLKKKLESLNALIPQLKPDSYLRKIGEFKIKELEGEILSMTNLCECKKPLYNLIDKNNKCIRCNGIILIKRT